MSEAEMKDYMHRKMYLEGRYASFVTEALWSSDVLVYDWVNGLMEFEIKTSRADLLGEIKCARVAWGLDSVDAYTKKKVQLDLLSRTDITPEQRDVALKYGHGLSTTKLTKHRHYATQHYGEHFIPKKFYFAVTPDLATLAKEKVKGLPYGVWSGGSIVRPAKRLKYQIREKDLLWLLTRACTERSYQRKYQPHEALSSVGGSNE